MKSASAIALCVRERRGRCEDALKQLRAVPAPAEIAQAWQVWSGSSSERHLREADVLSEILSTTKIPAKLRANGESWDGLIDWANAKHVPAATAYWSTTVAEAAGSTAVMDAERAILEQLPGVCEPPPAHCTVEKVMHGTPGNVTAPYVLFR